MKEIIERAERLGYKGSDFKTTLSLHEQRLKIYPDDHTFLMKEYDRDKYIELCLIQKWLREKKGVNVIIQMSTYVSPNGDNNYYIMIYTKDDYANSIYDYSPTYEQALEEGIKKALEILEKL